jgi:predicted RNA-binding Zn ribbon-like protein
MRFQFIAGAVCLDFANTIHNARAEDKEEELHAIVDLLQWAKEAGMLSSTDNDRLAAHYSRSSREAAATFTKAITIRNLVLSIFIGVANGRSLPAQRLAELNAALSQFPGLLRVNKHSERIEREWTSTAEGLQQVLFAVLTSAAELLASDRVRRVRECASADCTWLFVDDSRNRSRRWCEMRACGNRMKARRHYYKGR